MTLLGIDVSHHQSAPNFAAVKAAGNSFAFIKATEGVGYTDPAFAANRAAARAAGLVPGYYHFASAGNPTAEADYFCSAVGALKAGDLVALDWETNAPNPPAWCRTFLDRVKAKLGVKPLIYMNQSARDGSDWTPVIAGDYGLWLAQYDNSQAVPSPGRWPNVAMKQFTSSGSVPGIAGAVDRNVFFGDAATLARYGFPVVSPTQVPPVHPVPVPPTPNVGENDMRLIAADQRGVALIGAGFYLSLTGPQSVSLSKVLGAPTSVPVADFDAIRAAVTSASAELAPKH